MTRSILLALAILIAPWAAYGGSPEDRSWHLLTLTYGGALDLTRQLTEHECKFMRARALGEPATDSEKRAAAEKKRQAEFDEAVQQAKDENFCAAHRDSSNGNLICENGKPQRWVIGIGSSNVVVSTFAGQSCYFGSANGTGINGIQLCAISAPQGIRTAECFQ
jgi:hypothetical protein